MKYIFKLSDLMWDPLTILKTIEDPTTLDWYWGDFDYIPCFNRKQSIKTPKSGMIELSEDEILILRVKDPMIPIMSNDNANRFYYLLPEVLNIPEIYTRLEAIAFEDFVDYVQNNNAYRYLFLQKSVQELVSMSLKELPKVYTDLDRFNFMPHLTKIISMGEELKRKVEKFAFP